MGIRSSVEQTILNAKGADGVWNNILVQDFSHCVFSYATDGGTDAALTVNFQGSIQDTCPDFAVWQSVTNMWDYIEVIDLNTGSAIDWDTWVSVATNDDYRLFEANINGLKWINAIVSGRTQWEVTIKWCLFSNN